MRWSLFVASAFALALPVLLGGCSDHERRDDRGRYDDRRTSDNRDRDLRYDDTRYGDGRDGDVRGDGQDEGYRDVRWDDRDRLEPYDETDRATTNDEVSAPRSYGLPGTPGTVADPATSPHGGTQRRDLNPSPRDSVRRSSIP